MLKKPYTQRLAILLALLLEIVWTYMFFLKYLIL
jgi:hypothetical protein